MSNMLNTPKMSSSRVFEHGLFIGIVFALFNAALSFEALEIITGVIGTLTLCLLKANTSRKCRKADPDTVSSHKVDSRLQKAEPTIKPSVTDETPPCDADFDHLRTCVQAELNVLRVEYKLESWKNKADQAKAELAHLYDKIAELERDLSHQHSAQPWTDQVSKMRSDDLFVELTEAKLRAEEVEAELVHAHSNLAALDSELAQATSVQSRSEEAALMGIETSSTDLEYENSLSAAYAMDAMYLSDDFQVQMPTSLPEAQ